MRTFHFTTAGRALRALGQLGLLALSCGAGGCGGRQTDAVLDGPGSNDLRQSGNDSMGNALALSVEQVEAATLPRNVPGTGPDSSGGAWRVIEVPALSNSPTLVRSPLGWLALSNRSLGDGKAPSGYQSVLYRSTDGVHWAALPLGQQAENVRFSGLAYGSGRYVMIGQRYGGASVFWSSSDAQQWTESQAPSEWLALGRSLAHAHERFFNVGFNQVAVSAEGRDWRLIPSSLVQEGGAAYGNGVYVLTGSGPMQTSSDGWAWQEHQPDCSTSPRSCITDPSGGVHAGYHPSLIFAEGRFYTDELSSEDGVHWQAEPGRDPVAYAGGLFFGSLSVSEGLPVWSSSGLEARALRVLRPARAAVTAEGRAETSIGVLDRASPVPATVNVEFEDGLTCENAACVLIGDRLLLVPPLGTAPLVDRVPRSAAGAPLLSDACPVSSQIWCDDFDARSGCVCRPEAPRDPGSCQDVGQYRCAGRFTQRPNEWQLDELARAGCSCDAVDPHQPASLGLDCAEGASVCASPLACLPVDALPSPGPSIQRSICTSACQVDADCPSWQASGFCAGAVQLRCSHGSCQPRSCD